MRNLIVVDAQGARVVEDDWTLPGTDHGRALVTLPALRNGGAASGPCGLWLAADEDPHDAAPWLSTLAIIAIDFPSFTDGRGYSSAYWLRARLGWQGDVRAVGDVQRDQLYYMRRVGFTSFALRADRSAHDALGAFDDFAASYQASVAPAWPAFALRQENAK